MLPTFEIQSIPFGSKCAIVGPKITGKSVLANDLMKRGKVMKHNCSEILPPFAIRREKDGTLDFDPDFVFVLSCPLPCRRRLYELFFRGVSDMSFDEFDAMLDSVCKNFTCLVFDKNTNQLSSFKAELA